MLINLLAESTSANASANEGNGWFIWILLGFFVLMIVYNSITGKKRREEAEKEREKRNAIQPGFIVTTIGGILGTVVEVDEENNTFILATGKEDAPSYVKFEKVAIHSSYNPNSVEEKDVAEETDETKENEEADVEVFEDNEVVEETAQEETAQEEKIEEN